MELTIESYGRINRLGHLLADYDRARRSQLPVDLLDYTSTYPELDLLGDLQSSIAHYQHAWIITPDKERGELPMMDFVAWKLMEDVAMMNRMADSLRH